jgi:hypothetical protein
MRFSLRGPAALALAALLLPAVPGAGAATCGSAAAAKAGRWYVASPPLPAHSAAYQAIRGDVRHLRTVAVDPADPRVVLVTDGERLTRSDDGGCTWHEVWQLPATPAADLPSRDTGEITSIDVAHVGGRSRVIAGVMAVGYGLATAGGTYLVRSDDGRTGWTSTGGAVALAGRYDRDRGTWPPTAHTGAGGTVYAAIPSPAGTVEYLRSTDGGRTWTVRDLGTDPATPTSLTGFAVSPYDANDLWEWGGRTSSAGDTLPGVRHSTDGGTTWASVDPWPMFNAVAKPVWSMLDVAWPRPGRPARLLVLGTSGSTIGKNPPSASWSADGRTFQQLVPGTRLELERAAVTHTPSGDAIVVAPGGQALRVRCALHAPAARDWLPLPPTPAPPKDSWALLGPDLAKASSTVPPVVAVPTWQRLALLTVVR